MPVDYVTKYITFKFLHMSASGKTEEWNIVNNSSRTKIGSIVWYGPWRQYIFEPSEDTVWNSGCLREIQEFLVVRNAERRIAATKDKV